MAGHFERVTDEGSQCKSVGGLVALLSRDAKTHGEMAALFEADWTPLLGSVEEAEATGLTLFVSRDWENGGEDPGPNDYRSRLDDGTLSLSLTDHCDQEVSTTLPLSFTL